MSVIVVIPSRGRPARAAAAIEALRRNAAMVGTSIVLVVDADDPCLAEYTALRYPGFGPEVTTVTLAAEETGSLVKATNTVSMRIAHEDPDAVIGNLGDDHMARTRGWDRMVTETLATPGVAYGDDLLQGEALPTAPFISAEIALALGYYALPDLRHLFIDNVWRDVGAQTGTLRYLPGLVIEHLHPLAGKAEWDPGYERANGMHTVDHDRMAYESWREHAMATDIGRVRDALVVAA